MRFNLRIVFESFFIKAIISTVEKHLNISCPAFKLCLCIIWYAELVFNINQKMKLC